MKDFGCYLFSSSFCVTVAFVHSFCKFDGTKVNPLIAFWYRIREEREREWSSNKSFKTTISNSLLWLWLQLVISDVNRFHVPEPIKRNILLKENTTMFELFWLETVLILSGLILLKTEKKKKNLSIYLTWNVAKFAISKTSTYAWTVRSPNGWPPFHSAKLSTGNRR